jgi:hypothetical protein
VTVYRPSCKIKLTLRTEEYNDTTILETRLPPVAGEAAPGTTAPAATTVAGSDTSVERLTQNAARMAALQAQAAVLSLDDYNEQLAQIEAEREAILQENITPVGLESASPPESVSGVAPDDLTVIGDIEPLSVQIERNGLASADTARILLDYIDAPIDSRILRAAHCEIVMGVVNADDFEAGMERNELRSDGSLRSLIPTPAQGALSATTRFTGFVDVWSQEYAEEGDTISLELRDMSAPMRDIRLIPGLSIDLLLPIDEGIRSFLNAASATTRGTNVLYHGEGIAPIPASVAPTSRRRPRRGSRARRSRRNGQNTSIWDHITDVVTSVGLVPIMEGYDIALISPRTQFGTAGSKRMVFGRNLSKLAFSRKLMGVKVPTIEVRCYDADRGRTLWARHPVRAGEVASGIIGVVDPPRPLRANEVPPSGSNPDESIRTYTVSGITDSSFLETIAESIFEQLGRQEIEGSFETSDAWSYEEVPDNADLFDMVAGDAVELLLARADTTDDEELGSNPTLGRIEAMDTARRVEYMVALGWDPVVAARFAALQTATGFQTVFRVSDVRLQWDHDDGVRVGCSFINFITVREEEPSIDAASAAAEAATEI